MVLMPSLPFIRSLRTLRSGEPGFVLAVTAAAPAIELSLALVGLKKTLGWIERLPAAPQGILHSWPDIERSRQLVDGVYRRHILRGKCLPRALLRYALMRLAGRPVRFIIGVNTDSAFRAHAWIEAPDTSTPCPSTGTLVFEPVLEILS